MYYILEASVCSLLSLSIMETNAILGLRTTAWSVVFNSTENISLFSSRKSSDIEMVTHAVVDSGWNSSSTVVESKSVSVS